ncbi:alpha-glucosidase [Sediminihabitans luteus]|uniref:Alpha-glucosidase n=1 Tax=Sediminihabitans luteus TaxID=1138585 RepID=A0A2M9CPW4_9CELL|nr:glycoside hydrolase family 13 protein [Sediminihabitans luteus]PJJ73957.1 alpha-glucosidase [Sediminihabitans luteus]GII98130.1 alpha-glucosidase [Sediminihabitans luteus]
MTSTDHAPDTDPSTTELRATTLVHAASSDPRWWRDAVIYQVYPRSFADADGDGMGDLPGITARLDHLVDLGVDAVWLSPFYRSPQKDAGYDVADYRDVDPLFGTLEDADALLARAHALGLRVIVDLVPNHTSDQHAWFRAALAAAPGSPERARYVFRDGKGATGSVPPNNWQSIFGGPAWTRLPASDDDGPLGPPWYLHLFDSSQPDLDWSNPQVRSEFEDVLRFWLDRGVDGFRVDVAHGLVKAEGLPDWAGKVSMVEGTHHDARTGTAPALPAADVPPGTDTSVNGPMFDQDGVHEIYRDWRRVLDAYAGDRCLVAEAWVEPMERLARYVRPDEMHQAFNFAFLLAPWEAPALRDVVVESLETSDGVGAPTTWVLSNHDVVRHASRMGFADPADAPEGTAGIRPDGVQPDPVLGLRRARAATLLLLGLPGSAYLYQGEELGLPDFTNMPDDARQDPSFHRTGGADIGRDGCRVPLPWVADAPGFGFGPSAATWLPQPEVYGTLAADAQTGVRGSTLETYRAALAARREHGLGHGDLAWVDAWACWPDVVAYRNGDVVVLTNLGAEPVLLPRGAHVLVESGPTVADRSSRPQVRVPTDTTVWFQA